MYYFAVNFSLVHFFYMLGKNAFEKLSSIRKNDYVIDYVICKNYFLYEK